MSPGLRGFFSGRQWGSLIDLCHMVGYDGCEWRKVGIDRVTDWCSLLFNSHSNDPHVFIGEYKHSVDEKGRLAIPKKFRKDLAKGAVVTRGLDTSLFLFPKEEWGKLAQKLAGLPLGQSNSRAFARLMLAGAMDVTLDKQGRVVLPEYLRKYASLKKSVVVAGLWGRIEIWDEDTWNAYKKKLEGDAEAVAEQLGELGV